MQIHQPDNGPPDRQKSRKDFSKDDPLNPQLTSILKRHFLTTSRISCHQVFFLRVCVVQTDVGS